MKKIIPILALLSVFVFLNCSKSNSSEEEVTKIDKSTNLLGTGDSAGDILSNTKYDKLILEIGYVQGFKPTTTAIADLIEFLKERTFKENIEIQYQELDSPEKESLTISEIDKIVQENRTAYNSGSTLAIYIYFADAPSDGDEPEADLVTLGAAFRNTSMVIFESTVRELAGKSILISTGTVETATLNHEFGHLFGLVNIGSDMVNPHEGEMEITNDDGTTEIVPSQHCNQDNCLMRAELEFASAMGKMLTAKNGQVPDLDTECLLDLKANGGR
ncbi:hypothetical protein [Cellulophaga tyrosinoxydans]|uniref:Membrane metalloprotease n=1 Tax=Cellulophaga tyrosinoxydans TaxID=504486 RepID=A0A1W2ART7_9FLAO|nr:hypothetical protein [Cellulophaga tyrosinoxydans]SMC63232.1 hypothetical protein SAMN05660703_2173 [Cellulophaga tyrosinoxydans]